jgi:hypothetical protein
MASLGATIVDPVDAPDPFTFSDAEFTVLLYEFKVDIAKYLSGLRHTSMRTLADLIDFNRAHCEEEMEYFGQELFEAAEATTGLDDPVYLDARALCLEQTRSQGIDKVIADQNLDAIVAPIYSLGSSAPAVAGYPNISVPTGVSADGRHLDVQRIPAGTETSGVCLRPRAGDRRPAKAEIPRQPPAPATRCRYLRRFQSGTARLTAKRYSASSRNWQTVIASLSKTNRETRESSKANVGRGEFSYTAFFLGFKRRAAVDQPHSRLRHSRLRHLPRRP